jgi:anti-sigma B factor antagonist
MAEIDFNIQNTGKGFIKISLEGDLIGEAIGPRIMEEINDLLYNGHRKFLIDISNVRYVNSSGIGMLITMLTKVRNKEGEMVLMKPSAHFQKLLLITKLNKIFSIVETEDEAARILKHN